ncbi:MAG: DDE-type integrase/transposase/recombinase [Acidobacteriota bacterium]|nr:DDE-type integrase/transposase/recombinase [Acidobacteriota bacterium]
MENFDATQRKACELARIPRSTFRYRADDEKDNQLRMKLTQLAQEQPRYGYRRLEVLLRREGEAVNHKRIFRIYQAAGLSVKRKKRKRLVRAGRPLSMATAPNQQWAIDFVHDRLASGRSIRVLTVVDTFTRECLALEVDSCLPSRRVTRALDSVIFQRGRPESIRMDNELNASLFSRAGAGGRFSSRHARTASTAAIESDTEWSSTNKGTLLTIMNTRSAAQCAVFTAPETA